MSTLTEAVVWGDTVAPVGTTISGAHLKAVDLFGNSVGVDLTPGQTSAVLTLGVGTWVVSVQAFDQSNIPFGPVASDPVQYVVAAPTTITVSVPTTVTGVLV